MEVDEAGQAGRVRQVDRPRAGRRGQVLADGGDAAVRDLHVDGGRGFVGAAVDEPPAPENHRLRREGGDGETQDEDGGESQPQGSFKDQADSPWVAAYSLRTLGTTVSPAISTFGMPGAAPVQLVVPPASRNTPKSEAA